MLSEKSTWQPKSNDCFSPLHIHYDSHSELEYFETKWVWAAALIKQAWLGLPNLINSLINSYRKISILTSQFGISKQAKILFTYPEELYSASNATSSHHHPYLNPSLSCRQLPASKLPSCSRKISHPYLFVYSYSQLSLYLLDRHLIFNLDDLLCSCFSN